MIVEDDKSNLDILSLMLDMEGIECVGVSNPVKLLSRVKQQRPGLILMDIELGIFDGRDLCQQLKSDEQNKEIPVIILSAATESKLMSAYQYGADLAIPKPFELNYLLETVSK